MSFFAQTSCQDLQTHVQLNEQTKYNTKLRRWCNLLTNYVYKLRPNVTQSGKMDDWLSMLRSTYNWNLADRINQYYQQFIQGEYCDIRTKAEASPITCFVSKNGATGEPWKDSKTDKDGNLKNPRRSAVAIQITSLPQLKKSRPWFAEIDSTVLQQNVKRLDVAYKNFFEGRGFPKFKNRSNFTSFTFAVGMKIQGNKIYLPKVGWMRFHNSRVIPSGFTIKAATVRKRQDGWYVSVQIQDKSVPDYVPMPLTEVKSVIGCDLGLTKLVHLSDRHQINNPRFATNKKTRRKQAEQKILEQAALLDVATDAIVVQDLENKIVFWNKSAEHLYSWKVEETLGLNANKLLYKDPNQKLEEALYQVNLAGEWYGELSQVKKDGKEIIVETRWSLVRDQQGNPKSILTVNTDITEKKQLEAQLLRAQRLESLGTLASGIAHDLNNILAPMLMSAQLLQMKIADERKDRLLQTLETNAQRGAALVKQVLSFARGVEGKRTILQLRHLILEIQQFANQTFPKSIEFSTDIASDLWTIFGDATQLHQVLMNLIINARDAMPNGGVLSICAENFFVDQTYVRMNLEASIGPHIVITVRDTGIGMPPEIVDRIFDPFFTTKEVGRGTGLGLSTVLGILKSHGGFINVSSTVDKGTQFQVFLKAIPQNQTPPTEDLELPAGNGELILVVDDEATICEIAKTTLERYNYQVMTANDGIEAIALYVQHRDKISVVLIDMMMPGIDSLTTIRALQKMNPLVKVITSSGLVDSKQLTQASGIKTFLSKPYTVKQLLETLHNLLLG